MLAVLTQNDDLLFFHFVSLKFVIDRIEGDTIVNVLHFVVLFVYFNSIYCAS